MAGNQYHHYTNLEMADINLMYGVANCNSLEARRLYMYSDRFPGRVLPSHVTFQTIHQRLRETGSLKPAKSGKSGCFVC